MDGVGNVDPTPASYNWTIATDNTPPDTAITSNPSTLTNKTNATFIFTSTESGSTFACSLDSGAFAPCASPVNYSGLANGSHTFQVQATDSAGNTDQSPASFNWTIDTSLVSVLQGTLTDRTTGLPIVGAKVMLCCNGSVTVNTDGNGGYSFTGQQWPFTGGFKLFIQGHGYYGDQVNVNIAAPFPVTVDRTLLPGGSLIRGVVTDVTTNLPIANASVSYAGNNFLPGPTTKSVITDLSGNYAFDSSEFIENAATAGTSGQMTASASGYLQIRASVSAVPPYPSTQNFALPSANSVILQGTLTDRTTGLPIVGAKVMLCCNGSVTVNTDGNGGYSFTGQQWPFTGGFKLFIQGHGYYGDQVNVNIAAPFPVTVDRRCCRGFADPWGRNRRYNEPSDCKCVGELRGEQFSARADDKIRDYGSFWQLRF